MKCRSDGAAVAAHVKEVLNEAQHGKHLGRHHKVGMVPWVPCKTSIICALARARCSHDLRLAAMGSLLKSMAMASRCTTSGGQDTVGAAASGICTLLSLASGAEPAATSTAATW